MNYRSLGFRSFYQQFSVFPIIPQIKAALGDYQIPEDSNGILTYGFYDRESGFSLLAIATAYLNPPKTDYIELPDSVIGIIPIEDVADEDVLRLMRFGGQAEEELEIKFADRLSLLQVFDVGEEIELSRLVDGLDSSRDKIFIDHVLVQLKKKGVKNETCWVNITGFKDHLVTGELLEEPHHNFGYHKGDTIAVFPIQDKDGNRMAVCDVAASDRAMQQDSSKLLKSVLVEFRKGKKNVENAAKLSRALKSGIICYFGTPVISEDERNRILRKADRSGKNGDEYDALVHRLYSQLGIKIKPAYFNNKDGCFLMCFSSKEEMGEYAEPDSEIMIRETNIFELIRLGKNSVDDVKGIIINPFSDGLMIDAKVWDDIEKLEFL